jgi:hypothetical protein
MAEYCGIERSSMSSKTLVTGSSNAQRSSGT